MNNSDTNESQSDQTDPQNIKQMIHQIIRVNQAGEYGATRIYAGQYAALKNHASRDTIEHMLSQELIHLEKFNTLLTSRRVRPTFLSPLWHVGGFALGYITAKMGVQSAMACTVAIEDVIDEHYQQQEQVLSDLPRESELLSIVSQCRQEELEHKDIGIQFGANAAPFQRWVTHGIKALSKTAIWLSKRL